MKLPLLATIWLALLIPCTAGEIHDAVLKHDLAAVDRILKSKPSQINARLFPDCKTPLRLAIDIAAPDIVKRLLAAKADLTIPDADGIQPLLRAAFIAGDEVFTTSSALKSVCASAEADLNPRGKLHTFQPIPKPPAAEKEARLEVLSLLLAATPELNTGFLQNVTPIYAAVRANDADAVSPILKAGGKVNVEDALWNTPLHYAALNGADRSVIDLLIDQGARIEAKNKKGFTPLIYAQLLGRLEAVEALLARGARIEAEDNNSVSVIAHAAAFGHDEVVRLLYAKGGRSLIRDADPSALFQAAARGGSKALAEILLSEGIDVDVRDSSGFTPLLTTVEWDRRELAQFLIEKGANREAKNNAGVGLFRFACGNGNVALVKELLAAGTKVDVPSFVEAAASGRIDIVKLLIAQSADVNGTDATGWTPLKAAIWGRDSRVTDDVRSRAASGIASEDDYARVVELLLDHGAKIDVTSKDGDTPMHGAARYCGARVMKALLKAGGNPTREGERPVKMTPIHSAAVDGRGETVKVLLKAGAKPKEIGNDGNTPLHRAANDGNADTMKVLLAERVPLETKATFNGATALHMAAFTNSGECVRLLLAAGADPNSRDTSGASPLILAVALELSIKHAQNAPEGRRVRCVLRATDLRSRLETIQLLLEYGAKTDVFPNTYKSLADFAKAHGSPEIVELLLTPPPATKKPNKP